MVRPLGIAATLASLGSTLLLLASTGGRLELLIPFERVVEAPFAGLALAGLLVDAAFYALFGALVGALAQRGSIRPLAGVLGASYAVVGLAGAGWLSVSWATDFAAAGADTAWVYTTLWNGLNAGLGALFWAGMATDSRWGWGARGLCGILASLAACVGGLLALGGDAAAGYVLPILLAGLAIWPAIIGLSAQPSESQGT